MSTIDSKDESPPKCAFHSGDLYKDKMYFIFKKLVII